MLHYPTQYIRTDNKNMKMTSNLLFVYMITTATRQQNVFTTYNVVSVNKQDAQLLQTNHAMLRIIYLLLQVMQIMHKGTSFICLPCTVSEIQPDIGHRL